MFTSLLTNVTGAYNTIIKMVELCYCAGQTIWIDQFWNSLTMQSPWQNGIKIPINYSGHQHE